MIRRESSASDRLTIALGPDRDRDVVYGIRHDVFACELAQHSRNADQRIAVRHLSPIIYAAFRWVETQGGSRIIAIGRREILDIYLKVGLQALGIQVKSGAVTFELITATMNEVNTRLAQYSALLRKLERSLDWKLGVPFSGKDVIGS